MAPPQQFPDLVRRRLQAGVGPDQRLPAVRGGTAVRGESSQAAAGTLKEIIWLGRGERRRGNMPRHAGATQRFSRNSTLLYVTDRGDRRKMRGWKLWDKRTHFRIVLVNTKFSFCHNGPFSFNNNLIRPLLHNENYTFIPSHSAPNTDQVLPPAEPPGGPGQGPGPCDASSPSRGRTGRHCRSSSGYQQPGHSSSVQSQGRYQTQVDQNCQLPSGVVVVSKYLIQCLDDVTWLVFLSGQDYVDHLGDGSLYGERIVFTTWRSLYQWSSVGWKYQLPIKWWSKQILSKQE